MSEDNYSNFVYFSQSRFLNSAKKKNGKFNEAIRPGNPADRLFQELSYPYDPCHYSLHHDNLKIDKKMAASRYLYDHLIIKAWKMRIRQFVEPPYFFKFEVGEEDASGNLGELHVHLIADVDAGLLWIPRSAKSQIIKPITDLADFKRRIIYLYKPAAKRSLKAIDEYLDALDRIEKDNASLPMSKKRRQPPQISGYVWD
jgi:hypothetical protein